MRQAGVLFNGPTAQRLLQRLPSEGGAVGGDYAVASIRRMLNAFPTAADPKARKMRLTPFLPVRGLSSAAGGFDHMAVTNVCDSLVNGQVDGVDAEMELPYRMEFYGRAYTLLQSTHMIFPVVGLDFGRIWQPMSSADRDPISSSARKHPNSLFGRYVQVEQEMEKNVQSIKGKVVKVEPEFSAPR